MKGRFIKSAAACMAVAAIVFFSSVTAYAGSGYEEASGYAGSTKVTSEVGFNGKSGYAIVSASDNVDARMEGEAVYFDGKEMQVKPFSGGFEQRTYGDTGTSCPYDIGIISCIVDISSSDGEWSKYCYAN